MIYHIVRSSVTVRKQSKRLNPAGQALRFLRLGLLLPTFARAPTLLVYRLCRKTLDLS